MECNNCGYECEQDLSFCDSCGYSFNHSFYNHHPRRSGHGYSHNNYRPSYGHTIYPVVWSLIFGISGLIIGFLSFMYIWFLHFLGLGLGIIALILARRAAHENAPLSTGAIVIGLISVAMSFLGIFIIACTCTMAGEILTCQ